MPVSAAMLVFFTFQLGRRLFDTGTALAGAALVACSPVMLFMSLTPMADLPAAAFWIGALAMAQPRNGDGPPSSRRSSPASPS